MTDKENLQEKATKKSKKRVNFLQYSGMAIQMGATIGLFIFIGIKLDAWLETKALFTVIFSLFGVGITLYSFIKRVG
jgi:F0F1-type ATP synthase assembly protein I